VLQCRSRKEPHKYFLPDLHHNVKHFLILHYVKHEKGVRSRSLINMMRGFTIPVLIGSIGIYSVADPGWFIPDPDPTIAPSRIRGV
jgi:hypothetical protein